MSDYAAKGVLWYEGWNALNKILEQHKLSIWNGRNEQFVVIMNYHLTDGILNVAESESVECSSYAEAVTVAVEKMIERVKGGTK